MKEHEIRELVNNLVLDACHTPAPQLRAVFSRRVNDALKPSQRRALAASCNHGFEPGAHTQGVTSCERCR